MLEKAKNPNSAVKAIFTLGTSNRPPKEFIDLLQFYGIQLLADVRRFPTSRFEHFKKENLESLCHQNGISYRWLGERLGGYRSAQGGYEAFMTTNDFNRGIWELERIAVDKTVACCCAERLPWKCHRRFIGRKLEQRGWIVNHIIDKENIWSPKQIDLL